ncbi:MAG: hypothetical protein AABW58_01390 [Nanoarchaeota archaeon]
MQGKRRDTYQANLFGLVSETSTAIKGRDLEKARNNLEILFREFELMPHEGFMGGKSMFAVIYFIYRGLKKEYDKLITNDEEFLVGLA